MVKQEAAVSNQAEKMDEENLGAACGNAMSGCHVIHEATPQTIPTGIPAGQQQFTVMPPSDQDQSEPTNHV